jgi:hypothetical protein
VAGLTASPAKHHTKALQTGSFPYPQGGRDSNAVYGTILLLPKGGKMDVPGVLLLVSFFGVDVKGRTLTVSEASTHLSQSTA